MPIWHLLASMATKHQDGLGQHRYLSLPWGSHGSCELTCPNKHAPTHRTITSVVWASKKKVKGSTKLHREPRRLLGDKDYALAHACTGACVHVSTNYPLGYALPEHGPKCAQCLLANALKIRRAAQCHGRTMLCVECHETKKTTQKKQARGNKTSTERGEK